tara:strand:- start:23908 stop:24909 length:1002 start_codon:yes stop_codon:yes gene_type:complete
MTVKLKQKIDTIFTDIHNTFYDDIQSLNALIIDRLESPVPLIQQVACHLIQAGGKRIRPLLTFISAKMYGYRGDRPVHMGACIEFIHTATLLHDDVIDDSVKRRGLRSANDLWGNKTSILVGDFLFSKAFEFMVADENPEIMKVLSKAASVIASGEVLQLSKEKDLSLTEKEYFSIIESKTSALFSAASEVGTLIADASEKDRKIMADYGHKIGTLFQITDDILDFGLPKSTPGKNVGDDIKGGRITLPIIYLLKKKPAYKTLVEDCYNDCKDFELSFKKLQDALVEHSIFKEIETAIESIYNSCCSLLTAMPDTQEKKFLQELLSFTIYRIK